MISSKKGKPCVFRIQFFLFWFPFLLACGVSFVPSSAFAQEPSEAGLAPLHPDFLGYLQDQEIVRIQQLTEGSHPGGLIPSPLNLSHLKGQRISQGPQLLGFPSSFDLRQQGKVTPVRNQGSCGSCWSFATFGSLESNLLPTETWDFSEDNLINTHGFDRGPCDGGNADMATAYLVRWDGPVSEMDDPYNFTSPPDLMERKHLQEVLIVPGRASSLDNDNIKQAVMTYGAVYTSVYWSDLYYQSGYHAYSYSGAEVSNHAITIVGWDDNYDKNRFSTVPPGNGAFIIRNSWGSEFGENGYFYISYYDSNVGRENYVFDNAASTSNYSHIYQYDFLGWVGSLGYGNHTAWFANIFTAISNEPLAAVSFYTASLNSNYEIHIYDHVTSGPISGSHAGSKTGTVSLPGYHTVVLDLPVSLATGQKFSVVVKLTTPGYNYPIPIERPYSGYSSRATANPGESYISSNGTNWSDITNSYSNTNVCLKAFSTNPDRSNQNILDLITEYYQDILGRAPEPGGAEWWTQEIERVISLGIDVKEGFQALAKQFFNCEEYQDKNQTDVAFVTDLYQTFLQRPPNSSEVSYWVDYLAQGLTRNMLITQFAYCEEFRLYIEGIFGTGATRPENNLVNDLYRGFLNRFPDTAGYNGWVGLMRDAQCTGEQAVRGLTYQIALGFAQNQEYGLRNRNNWQYIEDLYNGILRRGADPAGFMNWVNLLNGETYTREQVLQSFVNSPEFQLRVQELIDAGCLP